MINRSRRAVSGPGQPGTTISRRGFLRTAVGGLVALPQLESLALGRALAAGGRGSGNAPTRMVFVYVPNGVIRRSFFPELEEPERAGSRELRLAPTLAPLEGLRSKVNLLSNLDRTFQQGTDVHAQCASCFLSSAAPYTVPDSAWPLERTLDQLIADQVGEETPFRSLELSCNSHKDNRESMYFDNISWFGTGHVAPSLRDPQLVYQRLFGAGSGRSSLRITDLVLEDARAMRKQLGGADVLKLEEYFDSVRSIELQIERLERTKSSMPPVAIEEPAPGLEVGLPRGEYIRLMGDLMVLALQTGLTRVATLMIAPERWNTPFMYEGVFKKPVSHHTMSHDPDQFRRGLEKIDLFNLQQLAYILERMDSIEEVGGGTLLDSSLVVYGAGLSNGASHRYDRLPILTAGSAGGRIETGRQLHSAPGTPLANLWLSCARLMGVEGERFADSTGELTGLLAS